MPLFDLERNRKQFEERAAELKAHPDRAKIFQRARIRVVKDYLKEAQVGPFTIRSDEHQPVGGGEAPSPLQYFVAATGF